jgi:hypothetical protein
MPADSWKEVPMSEGIEARPVGRIVRLLMGGALTIHVVAGHLIGASPVLSAQVAGIVLALIVFYVLVQLLISRFVPTINRWVGAVLAVAPVLLVFMMGGPPVRTGVVLFLGISLLLTGLRSDAGCEVMTLPGMILGKRTHLVCIVLSPLDWVEEKLAGTKEHKSIMESS